MRFCVIFSLFWLLSSFGWSQNVSEPTGPTETISIASIPKGQFLLDSIQLQFKGESDSIKGTYVARLQRLDSLLLALVHQLDSLKPHVYLTNKITTALDSINKLRNKTVADLEEKIQALKSKTIGRLKELNLPPELNEKISALTGDIENFAMPSDLVDIPSINLPRNSLDGLNELNMPASFSNIGKVDELKGVTGELGNISDISAEGGSYGQDVQQLANGNLEAVPTVIEEKAADLSGLKDMQKQADVLDEYKDQAAQFQNPESMKEQGVERLQQAAMDHFAGRGQVVQEAMDKMAKYKEKYESLPSLSDVPKKLPNAMRGKPLVERIVPGFMIQIQKDGNDLLLDFNPYVGYRFTGKLTAGTGWNQRFAYDTKANSYNSKPRVFGPRIYAEYNLWKGFFPRVEVEVMNAYVSPLTKPATIDQGSREWVWGVFVGIKKEYKFLKTVKGTALIMTRLFDPHHKSPYADVINARFGFEFPLKKKTKAVSKN